MQGLGQYLARPFRFGSSASRVVPSRARRAQFTLTTMPARLEKLGDLFRPALEDRQDLMGAIAALQKLFEE